LSGLVRAAIHAINSKVDLINMSYGEAVTLPNQGRFIQLAKDLVRVRRLFSVNAVCSRLVFAVAGEQVQHHVREQRRQQRSRPLHRRRSRRTLSALPPASYDGRTHKRGGVPSLTLKRRARRPA
jgi:hypothetical protein